MTNFPCQLHFKAPEVLFSKKCAINTVQNIMMQYKTAKGGHLDIFCTAGFHGYGTCPLSIDVFAGWHPQIQCNICSFLSLICTNTWSNIYIILGSLLNKSACWAGAVLTGRLLTSRFARRESDPTSVRHIFNRIYKQEKRKVSRNRRNDQIPWK